MSDEALQQLRRDSADVAHTGVLGERGEHDQVAPVRSERVRRATFGFEAFKELLNGFRDGHRFLLWSEWWLIVLLPVTLYVANGSK
jgi:hypothetical protein